MTITSETCVVSPFGSANLAPQAPQAFADSVPLLVLPGGHDRNRAGVHPGFQAVDNYGGITKWSGLINMVERIPEMMGRAFSQLKHGRLGPVLLEIPQDVAIELAKLDPGEVSTALTRANGETLVFLMLCNRTTAANADVNREAVVSSIRQRKLEGYATQLLEQARAEARITRQ